MDKVTSSFRPNEVSLGSQLAVRCVIFEASVLRQPLTGIVRIEQILTRLHILDTHLAKQTIEVVSCHVQLFPYLSDGETRNRIKHMVGIVGAWFQLCNLLVSALQGSLHDLECSCQDHFIAFVRSCHDVASLFADAWEDFAGDPMLESSCAFQLR